jgi:hypothetical protein
MKSEGGPSPFNGLSQSDIYLLKCLDISIGKQKVVPLFTTLSAQLTYVALDNAATALPPLV